MPDFGSHTQVRILRKVLESNTDPRRRLILARAIEHADAEGNGRYPELIATCSKRRQSYRYWGSGDSSGTSAPVTASARSWVRININIIMHLW